MYYEWRRDSTVVYQTLHKADDLNILNIKSDHYAKLQVDYILLSKRL